MSQLFQCPSCNAPLEYDGVKSLVGCPYCGNNVIVPETLRPRQQERPREDDRSYPKHDVLQVLQMVQELAKSGQSIQAIRLYRDAFGVSLAEARDAVQALASGNTIVPPPLAAPFGRVYRQNPQQVLVNYQQGASRRGRAGWWVFIIVLLSILGAVISFALPLWTVKQTLDSVPDFVNQLSTSVDQVLLPTATPVPTPGFATLEYKFGSEGVGPGRFNDARGIALDQDGQVYVSEYSTGRVQVFDEDGKFVTQWTIADSPYLANIAVSRDGVLSIASRGEVDQFTAENGAALGELVVDESGDVQDTIFAMPDGGWVTVVDDDIVRVNSAGEVMLRIPDAFANATGSSEMLPIVAADGLGNIYALGRFANLVLKFAPDGRYLTRFGGSATSGTDTPGTLRAPQSLAVDGLGRVLVGDIFGIQVYDSDGRYQGAIDTESYPFGMAVRDDGTLFTIERDHVGVYHLNQ